MSSPEKCAAVPRILTMDEDPWLRISNIYQVLSLGFAVALTGE
jgi:hypothetical protein